MAIVDVRVLAGERFNILETGTTSLVVATADASFPLSNVYDGRPSRAFRTAAAIAYPSGAQIVVDGNALVNGAMETWSGAALATWIQSLGGTVTQTTVAGEFVVGSAAKLATLGGAPVSIYQDFTVRSGEARTIDFWMRSEGVATAYAQIQNLQTGKYLTSAGAWAAGVSFVATMTGAAYVHTVLNYAVEPFSTTQAPLVTLRLRFGTDSLFSNGVFVDEVADYPAANFLSVHGHNLDQGLVLGFYSSTDNFVTSVLEATPVNAQPAFYVLTPALVYRRYFSFSFIPTVAAIQSAIPELGEVVIGQAYALTQGPMYGAEMSYVRDDVTTEAGAGEQHVYARSKHSRRTLALKFRFDSETKYRAARDEVFRRCGGHVNPLVIIPDTTQPDVLYGRIDRSWKVTRSLIGYYDNNDLVVAESPFAIATN